MISKSSINWVLNCCIFKVVNTLTENNPPPTPKKNIVTPQYGSYFQNFPEFDGSKCIKMVSFDGKSTKVLLGVLVCDVATIINANTWFYYFYLCWNVQTRYTTQHYFIHRRLH